MRKINQRCDDASTCEEGVELAVAARRRHGAGVASGSWTTAPSIAMRALLRYPSSQIRNPLASTDMRCTSVYGLFSMALTRMMASC